MKMFLETCQGLLMLVGCFMVRAHCRMVARLAGRALLSVMSFTVLSSAALHAHFWQHVW